MAQISENEKPALLLVEGKEDVRFFKVLVSHLRITNTQIRDMRGKSQMNNTLLAMKSEQKFLDHVVSLGIIRDADANAESTFDSICSSLKKAKLAIPRKRFEVIDGNPKVSVLVVPTYQEFGMLEDVCFASASDTQKVIDCVEDYFGCLPHRLEPHVLPKAKLQVYLAGKKPELRLGEAAEAGFWNWEHEVFQSIKDFLQQLSSSV